MTDNTIQYDLYYYKAKVIDVYDGDTITVDIDLGFDMIMRNQKIRLYGIDTPEVRGEEKQFGYEVRDFLKDQILGETVILKSFKDEKGKFGRWLAEIIFEDENMNKLLLEKGMAKEYLLD